MEWVQGKWAKGKWAKGKLERATGLEPAASCLGSKYSTN